MPEKTFFCDENFARIEKTLKRLVQELHEDGLSNPVVLDDVVLKDCYIAAKQSVSFYKLDEGSISYYKELAHIAYWIAKLKPFRMQNPFKLLETAKKFKQDITAELTGLKLKEEQINSDLAFALNEYLAFFMATTLISACQRDEISNANVELQPAYLERLELSNNRALNLQYDIINSMRYHNYSARGFAMTIEGIMRIAEI